jgi:catechol 2,3-dioxygenase-like lactoylglutathione lyase family enzyme
MNKKIVELNHVALLVGDVGRSCEFYQGVLGLAPMARPAFDFPGAWFRLGAVQELHLIGGTPGSPVPGQPRGNHFALRVEDLEAWRQHLHPLGLIVRGPVRRPDGAMQIFVRDPDGHVVELFTGPDRK